MQPLQLYNTLSRQKEFFQPLHAPLVGMYVCGPTVYGPPHLGHGRPYTFIDVLIRYLRHIGYQVRYVRNITDVGHLENDADEGEDKLAKRALIEKLEPMEVAERYTKMFHKAMELLNNLPPSIEPRASGHIIEQIEMIKDIIEAGLAYESNGSVYFDVVKYNEGHTYGKLSGRIIEELQAGAGAARRELEAQSEKRNPNDFALWKKASPSHIMRWPSPWSDGFPGWHIECSAMSTRYLGKTFDIHGGGMDLLFPHHECEIAQDVAANKNETPVKYWVHSNMITINGQKMGKSLNNAIDLEGFFSGNHPLLEQAYSPMTIRFFMLQAHYRSTLDFSNEALKAAEKGLARLMQAQEKLDKLPSGSASSFDVQGWIEKGYAVLNDDLNTPLLIAQLFEGASWINQLTEGKATLTADDLKRFQEQWMVWSRDILGLLPHGKESDTSGHIEGLMNLILELRTNARTNKDFATSDLIRDQLAALGFTIKDSKEGSTWSY